MSDRPYGRGRRDFRGRGRGGDHRDTGRERSDLPHSGRGQSSQSYGSSSKKYGGTDSSESQRERGEGRGGHPPPSLDRLTDQNMFEVLNQNELTVSDNPLIQGCGELYGTHGAVLSLSTNYFRVVSIPNRSIHQYSVTFTPDVESVRLKIALLKSQSQVVKSVSVFDGSTLFLPEKIQDIAVVVKSKHDVEYTIAVKYVSTVLPGTPSSIILYNNIMKKIMGMLQLKQIKRKHYNSRDAMIMENCGLEVWPGVTGSFNFFHNIPLFCVDVSHHVMRRESAYDVMSRQAGRSDKQTRENLEKIIVGQIVMTRYNNRTYRVDAIDWEQTPKSTFKLKNDESISYVDYYKNHYDITIQDVRQPLLVSRMKDRRIKHEEKQAEIKGEKREAVENIVHLIPELSYLTGISDDIRSNFSTMKELSHFTRLSPTSRCNGVVGFLNSVRRNNEACDFINSWGLELKPQLTSVPARKYPPERILFMPDGTEYFANEKDADFTQAFRTAKLLNPVSLEKWFLIVGERDQSLVNSFLKMLNEASRTLGFRLNNPQFITLRSLSASEVIREMRKIEFSHYNMGMFVIPPNRKEIYDAIKSVCCVDCPLPTQVILAKTLTRQNALRSVATKVAVQMCAKLGGEPWSLVIPFKQKMIVGIDVCHDTGSSRNSWLGFVASLNDNFSRYYSRACRQPSRTEISDTLCVNLRNALLQYHQLHSSLPNGIFFYRDGVGDGQVEMVKMHELPAMMNAITQTYSELGFGTPPQIAYIIVRKRINTKLFFPSGSFANNPLPATVVDRVITKDEYPNYYLISQSVREGTVNPTHYIIIHNDSKFKTDQIQRLTFKICHLYYNWMGTVRVPAPCQYAHKLCFLVSQSIQREPSSQLNNLLFYL